MTRILGGANRERSDDCTSKGKARDYRQRPLVPTSAYFPRSKISHAAELAQRRIVIVASVRHCSGCSAVGRATPTPITISTRHRPFATPPRHPTRPRHYNNALCLSAAPTPTLSICSYSYSVVHSRRYRPIN